MLLVRRPSTLQLTAIDALAPFITAATRVDVVRISRLELASDATELVVGGELLIRITFLSADGTPLTFDSCEAVDLSWSLEGGGAFSGPPAAQLELDCPPTDMQTPHSALLRLQAVSAGMANVRVTLTTGCDADAADGAAEGDAEGAAGGTVEAHLTLRAFEAPPTQPVHLCSAHATAGEAPQSVAVRLHALPSPVQMALLRGAYTVVTGEADALVIDQISGSSDEPLSLPMSCRSPHTQTVELRVNYSEAMPPVAIPLEVTCGVALSRLDGQTRPLALDVGESVQVMLRGAWAGAEVRLRMGGEARTGAARVGSIERLMGDKSLVDGAWQFGVVGLWPGSALLSVDVFDGEAAGGESLLESCALQPGLTVLVGIGSFVIACPSATILEQASMVCYALHAA